MGAFDLVDIQIVSNDQTALNYKSSLDSVSSHNINGKSISVTAYSATFHPTFFNDIRPHFPSDTHHHFIITY
jgi:hypothetical protein